MIKKNSCLAAKLIALSCLALLLVVFSACTQPATEQPSTETPSEPAAAPETPAEAPSTPTAEPSTAPSTPTAEPSTPTTAPEAAAEPAAPKVAEAQKPAAAESKAASATKMVPIDIKLPKYLLIGTPQNIVVDHFEKPTGKPRPPFLAPEGTTNVALDKKVTSSDKAPIIGELEFVTDGDKDSSDGHYLQLGPGVQWVQIDLGEMDNIYAIVVWHLHKQPVAFFDVIVQTADDANFIENVNTIFNNDIDNSAGLGVGTDYHYTETYEGKLMDAKGVQGRYVRLYSNGYNLGEDNYYTEVEVYGKPVK